LRVASGVIFPGAVLCLKTSVRMGERFFLRKISPALSVHGLRIARASQN